MYSKGDLITTSHKDLMQELCSHFECVHGLPPLAAKIYSFLLLNESETLIFEDIINLTCASKSSVSNQLNYLIDEGRVDFIYKDDKRKRHFKPKCAYFKKTLESHLIKINQEIKILSKVVQHKQDQNFNKRHVDIFKNHLEIEKQHLKVTIQQLKQAII